MSGAPIVERPGDKWSAGIARIARIRALWRLRGAVLLSPDMTNERAISRLAQLLEEQRKTVSERGDDRIGFDGTLAMNDRSWRSMAPYQAGRFWIEAGWDGRTLRYEAEQPARDDLCSWRSHDRVRGLVR